MSRDPHVQDPRGPGFKKRCAYGHPGLLPGCRQDLPERGMEGASDWGAGRIIHFFTLEVPPLSIHPCSCGQSHIPRVQIGLAFIGAQFLCSPECGEYSWSSGARVEPRGWARTGLRLSRHPCLHASDLSTCAFPGASSEPLPPRL